MAPPDRDRARWLPDPLRRTDTSQTVLGSPCLPSGVLVDAAGRFAPWHLAFPPLSLGTERDARCCQSPFSVTWPVPRFETESCRVGSPTEHGAAPAWGRRASCVGGPSPRNSSNSRFNSHTTGTIPVWTNFMSTFRALRPGSSSAPHEVERTGSWSRALPQRPQECPAGSGWKLRIEPPSSGDGPAHRRPVDAEIAPARDIPVNGAA